MNYRGGWEVGGDLTLTPQIIFYFYTNNYVKFPRVPGGVAGHVMCKTLRQTIGVSVQGLRVTESLPEQPSCYLQAVQRT